MLHILFCGNTGVFDGMLTCALSLVMRTESAEPFTFHVFTMDVSHLDPKYTPVTDAQIAFFVAEMQRYNPENRAVRVDVTDLYK